MDELVQVKCLLALRVIRMLLGWAELGPPNHAPKPVPQDVATFADRIFKEVVKLKLGH